MDKLYSPQMAVTIYTIEKDLTKKRKKKKKIQKHTNK